MGDRLSALTKATSTFECQVHARIDEQASEMLTRIAPVDYRVRVLVGRADVDAGRMIVGPYHGADGGHDAMDWLQAVSAGSEGRRVSAVDPAL